MFLHMNLNDFAQGSGVMANKEITREEALAHFGVKGMKWGVVNEDQPMSKEQKRENKAKKFDAKAELMNTKISDLQKEIDNLPGGVKAYYKKAALQAKIHDAKERRDYLLKDAKAVRNKKLTSTQKKLLVGGIAAAALVGTVAASSAYGVGKQSGEIDSLLLRGEAFLKTKSFDSLNNPFNITKNSDLLQANMSPSAILNKIAKPVNPLYDTAGGHMNCRRCTFTHELRRRGYDVRATTSMVGWGQSESGLINAVTKGTRDKFGSTSLSTMVVGGRGIRGKIATDSRINPVKTTSSIKKEISKFSDLLPGFLGQPNGARGEIVFDFEAFGHSMAYEIFDGQPVIFDSQKGVMYRGVDGIKELTSKWGIPSGAEITRLDDVDLDLAFLSRWATRV